MNIRSRNETFLEQQRLVRIHGMVSTLLKKYPNVVSVGIGAKESQGFLTHELCFRVYVDEKKSGLKDAEMIPKRILGEVTDVIAVGEINKCEGDFTKFRPLQGGGMIRSGRYEREGKNSRGAGTMGVIVAKNGGTDLYGLTCHHVVDDGVNSDTAQAFPNGLIIGQPRYVTCCCCCHYNQIGTVFESSISDEIDCALVGIGTDFALELKGGEGNEAVTSNNAINTIDGIGVITGVAQAVCFEELRKRGAGTGLTTGTVVDIMYGAQSNQLLVQAVDPTMDFADGGDSGAVLVNSTNQVVGLLWGVQRKTPAMLAAERLVVNPAGPTTQAARDINAANVPATATQGNTAGRAALQGHGVANHIAPVLTALDITIAGQGVAGGMGIPVVACGSSSSVSSSVSSSSSSTLSSLSSSSSSTSSSTSSSSSTLSSGSSSSSSSIPIVDTGEWKAWPGGQGSTRLNIYETFRASDFGFAGNCDWNVGNGGVAGTIRSTGSSTATGKSRIRVRFDTASPSNSNTSAAYVECIQAGTGKRKRRTVFRVFVHARNVSSGLHASNNLDFSPWPDTGTDINNCGFNRPGDHGATRYAGKVEIIYSLRPQNINWVARGVRFRLQGVAVAPPGDQKGDVWAMRDNKFTDGRQTTGAPNRTITTSDWTQDGNRHTRDCQYPSATTSANFIFTLDGPGFSRGGRMQAFFRDDFREFVNFHDGSRWRRIAYYAYWYCNITANLPNSVAGLPSEVGTGLGAIALPNSAPVVNAGPDQAVATGANVNLGATATDADNDQIVNYIWRQTSGINVALNNANSRTPSFSAPGAASVLVFEVIAQDNTNTIRFPSGSHQSVPDTVTITVS